WWQHGTEAELPQRHLGVQEQQTGELTGKNRHLIYKEDAVVRLYCVGLGILSSMALGTGLYAFLFYLVRHSDDGGGGVSISLWTIVTKVRMEAGMWVSACYTLAVHTVGKNRLLYRASWLCEPDPDDRDHGSFEGMRYHSWSAQVTLNVRNIKPCHLYWFFQIPSPLFDLAENACEHFPVPLWASFGATLTGKAVIKMYILKLFVILTFSTHTVEQMVSLNRAVPLLGAALQKPFREYLEAQEAKLHHGAGEGIPTEKWLSWLFEKVVVMMVCFFVCSIVNAMAPSYAKHKQQEKHSQGKME
uniref:Uncharacterized protein n=1 Tax=Monopterus albus TaxID=43700 RepID=A0A3Q3IED6_MONAL